MTQDQERRLEDTKTWKKGKGKSIGHQRAECPGVKARKKDRLTYCKATYLIIFL